MKMPPGFIPDEYAYTFIYEKDGKQYEFTEDSLPEDEAYIFKDRTEKLVKKGNDLKPNITDFTLVTASGNDTTQALLNTPGKYVLMFARSFDVSNTHRYNKGLMQQVNSRFPLYIVTADVASAGLFSKNYPVLKCDGTVIKTAARANPTYFVMQGAKVLGKFSYANTEEMLEMLK
jgi:hypothetical protein